MEAKTSTEAQAECERRRAQAGEARHTDLRWEAVSHYVRTVMNADGSGGWLICDCGANVPGNAEMAGYIAAIHNAALAKVKGA